MPPFSFQRVLSTPPAPPFLPLRRPLFSSTPPFPRTFPSFRPLPTSPLSIPFHHSRTTCAPDAECLVSDSSSEPSSSYPPEQEQDPYDLQSDPQHYDPYNPYAYPDHNGHLLDDAVQVCNLIFDQTCYLS